MPVYIIRDGDTDRVKIGWSIDPEGRRSTFQTHHHSSLTILRIIEGPRSTEKWMQHRFADRRINREWFVFCEEMLTVQPEVSPPKARKMRWHLLPSETCVYCCSAKPPTGSSVCEDCTTTFKRLDGLPKPERERAFSEFHKAMAGRILTPARRRGLMPVYRLMDERTARRICAA
jgi:hypothetical protein